MSLWTETEYIMLVQTAKPVKKQTEVVALADLFNGKVEVEKSDDTPKISKGRIVSADEKDGTYAIVCEGCVGLDGKPSVWQAETGKRSIMLAYASNKIQLVRAGKKIDAVLTVSVRLPNK
jgi:hypothetical protein